MKNKFTLLFVFAFTITSCELDINDDPKHYKLDSNYIPTVYQEVGKVITFKNQLKEEIKLEVLSYDLTTEEGGGMSMTQPYSASYTYDNLKIELKITDSNSNCDLKTINLSIAQGYFLTKIETKTSPDPCLAFYSERLEFPNTFSNLKINHINYDKVVTIFKNAKPYFSSTYTFDYLYYDFKQGIIGFDDLQNNNLFRIDSQ